MQFLLTLFVTYNYRDSPYDSYFDWVRLIMPTCYTCVAQSAKRQISDLDITGSCPSAAIRHVDLCYVILSNSPNKFILLSWLYVYICITGKWP